jgi:hypothetical protein
VRHTKKALHLEGFFVSSARLFAKVPAYSRKGCPMTSVHIFATLSCALLLCACTPSPGQGEGVAGPAPATSGTTVEDLMVNTIAPGAEALWRAVSYVATDTGVTETAPQSDADWNRLRDSANALIAAGDELQATEREILTNAYDPATAAFQYSPNEIRELLTENPEPWRSYAQLMQERTRMTLQAIEFRDLMGLVEFGAQVNEACEGCHAAYWYRAPDMVLPR